MIKKPIYPNLIHRSQKPLNHKKTKNIRNVSELTSGPLQPQGIIVTHKPSQSIRRYLSKQKEQLKMEWRKKLYAKPSTRSRISSVSARPNTGAQTSYRQTWAALSHARSLESRRMEIQCGHYDSVDVRSVSPVSAISRASSEDVYPKDHGIYRLRIAEFERVLELTPCRFCDWSWR